MKFKVLFVLALMTFSITKGQEVSVEKSIFGLQTGLWGFWGHNEFKISNKIAFRSEIGLDNSIWGGDIYDGNGFIFTPVITVEPRWYYNLQKRESIEKNIDGNSANFISFRISHHPNWFSISNQNVNVISDISFNPTWGIRRNLGRYFNFEASAGIEYWYIFAKNSGFSENENEIALNVILKIGYKFKIPK